MILRALVSELQLRAKSHVTNWIIADDGSTIKNVQYRPSMSNSGELEAALAARGAPYGTFLSVGAEKDGCTSVHEEAAGASVAALAAAGSDPHGGAAAVLPSKGLVWAQMPDSVSVPAVRAAITNAVKYGRQPQQHASASADALVETVRPGKTGQLALAAVDTEQELPGFATDLADPSDPEEGMEMARTALEAACAAARPN